MQNRYNVEIVNYIFRNIQKNIKLFDNIITYFSDNFHQIFFIIKKIEFDRII